MLRKIDELVSSSEPAGNASWTSGKMLIIIAMFAVSGISLVVTLSVVFPDVLGQVGMVILGLGGFVIGLIAVFVLLWNFYKILRDDLQIF